MLFTRCYIVLLFYLVPNDLKYFRTLLFYSVGYVEVSIKVYSFHSLSPLPFPFLRISSVELLSRVRLFATPCTAKHQASLSITNSQSLLKLMSKESVMPSNHLLCCLFLFLPSTFPGIRVFSNESVLRIRWPKYWTFSLSITPSNEYSGLISFRMDWLDLLAVQGLSRVFSNTTVQKR